MQTRDDRPRTHGRQHGRGASCAAGTPRVVYDRNAERDRSAGQGGSRRRRRSTSFVAQARAAARRLADGAGGACVDATIADLAGRLAVGRHHHRRRQLATTSTTSARARALAREGHPLRRRRHERRRLGPRARLLPDDRRRGRRSSGRLDPIFKTLAPGRGDIAADAGPRAAGGTAEDGYLHCGPSGAGHFVKMVHNGIEYGLDGRVCRGHEHPASRQRRQARHAVDAETTPLRNPEHYQYEFNLRDVAEVWRRGSVVASWLLDLTARALAREPDLAGFSGRVSDSGEGRWTMLAGIESGTPTRCSAPRSTNASPRAAKTISPVRCCPPCGSSSAATWRRRNSNGRALARRPHAMRVLVIDIGGTNIKVRASGQRQAVKIPSGHDMTAGAMAREVARVIAAWRFDVVSIGYPGPVVRGRPLREPHNLGGGWVRFDYKATFKRPVRIINDAAMQALGSSEGRRMLFLGLGTGLGSAMVGRSRRRAMELAHLPYRRGLTFEDYVGARGLERLGRKRWQKHVFVVVGLLREALQTEEVVLGGGNTKKLTKLPDGVRLGSNEHAFRGGVRLWNDRWLVN